MKNLKEYILNENNFFKNLGIGQVKLIKDWLNEHKIKNYTINKDFTIDINGSVDLAFYKKEQLPDYIQFGVVNGDNFSLYHSDILSLKGCPQRVQGEFDCGYCKNLKSLDGCPQEVGGDFACEHCGKKFTITDIEKICKVKGQIYV